MSQPSPNFDGFREAQHRLRQQFGQDLPFIAPAEETWPVGTEINPETGRPYDPEVEPETSGEVRTIVRVNVVSRPIGGTPPKDQVTKKAIGWLKEGGIVLIVDIADYHLVRDATQVEYGGETYTIRDDEHDYLGPVDRWLLYATL